MPSIIPTRTSEAEQIEFLKSLRARFNDQFIKTEPAEEIENYNFLVRLLRDTSKFESVRMLAWEDTDQKISNLTDENFGPDIVTLHNHLYAFSLGRFTVNPAKIETTPARLLNGVPVSKSAIDYFDAHDIIDIKLCLDPQHKGSVLSENGEAMLRRLNKVAGKSQCEYDWNPPPRIKFETFQPKA